MMITDIIFKPYEICRHWRTHNIYGDPGLLDVITFRVLSDATMLEKLAFWPNHSLR